MEDRSTLDESSVIVAVDHATSAQVEGESVILDMEEGVYYGLNPTGSRIWEAIQEERRVEEVVSIILEQYNVDPEKCRKDVVSLVKRLEENDLVNIK